MARFSAAMQVHSRGTDIAQKKRALLTNRAMKRQFVSIQLSIHLLDYEWMRRLVGIVRRDFLHEDLQLVPEETGARDRFCFLRVSRD